MNFFRTNPLDTLYSQNHNYNCFHRHSLSTLRSLQSKGLDNQLISTYNYPQTHFEQ